MILGDRQFLILIMWFAAFIGMALTGATHNGGILPVFLFLAMPAVATLPVMCRFLFRPLSGVLIVIILTVSAAVWAIIAWRHGQISDFQIVMILTPVYQLAVVAGAYRAFVRVLNREPVDVTLNFADGLAWDRLFAIMTFLLALLVPVNVYGIVL